MTCAFSPIPESCMKWFLAEFHRRGRSHKAFAEQASFPTDSQEDVNARREKKQSQTDVIRVRFPLSAPPQSLKIVPWSDYRKDAR